MALSSDRFGQNLFELAVRFPRAGAIASSPDGIVLLAPVVVRRFADSSLPRFSRPPFPLPPAVNEGDLRSRKLPV
jgi:hypothetical protein